MSERLKFQGRLAEKELEAKDIRLRIEGLREAIRDALDPFEPVEDIKAHIVARQAVDLSDYHIQFLELLEEIKQLKIALGMKS